jgi:trimeric autotransporter adhesin
MSTKTTFKRVALVAVASLGFGVLTSVAPASAAVTALTAGTSSPSRIGVESLTTITPTLTTGHGTTTFVAAAKITAAPATSKAMTDTNTSTLGVIFKTRSSAGQVSNLAYVAGGASATITPTSETASSFSLGFTADVAGTYTILVSTNASGTAYAAGDPSVAVTITTAGAPTSITLARTGNIVEGATFGAVMSVSLKDANGIATVLGQNESLIVTQTADAADVHTAKNRTYTLVAANTSVALATADGSSGVYYVSFKGQSTIAASGTNTVTVTGSGLLPATLTSNIGISVVNTGTATGAAAGSLALTDATGYVKTAGTAGSVNFAYDSAGSSHGFTTTFTKATVAANYAVDVDLTSAAGATIIDYATSIAVAVDDASKKFTIAQALSSTGVSSFVVTVGTGTATITRAAAHAATITVTGQSSVLSATAGVNKFTVEVDDQYGNPVAFRSVSVAVAGRNTVASTTLGVTDANGLISYTLTDKGTTGTRDTITFSAVGGANGTTALTDAVAIVTYGTVTVDKVVVSGGSKAETVAGSTLTSINAADNGPETSRKAIKAVVTDASGNLLAGVPVVFTVSSGAIYKTAAVDFATVYTGADGSATTHVFDWKPGTQTITATAGGKSSTDYLTWAANTASAARVLSATATGDIVSLKVVDRFGNAVQGVAIDLSRTGAGLFGNGASTQTISTDKNGTADVRFIGSGTVVAELAATYAQAYDKAGDIDGAAATAVVAGTTKGTGATLAPAGVAKVSIAISEGSDPVAVSSQAAADAAAEATDAANAATDAANAAAEAADAATAAAQDAADAVAALSTSVSAMISDLKRQITALTNLVIKIQRKVRA